MENCTYIIHITQPQSPVYLDCSTFLFLYNLYIFVTWIAKVSSFICSVYEISRRYWCYRSSSERYFGNKLMFSKCLLMGAHFPLVYNVNIFLRFYLCMSICPYFFFIMVCARFLSITKDQGNLVKACTLVIRIMHIEVALLHIFVNGCLWKLSIPLYWNII